MSGPVTTRYPTTLHTHGPKSPRIFTGTREFWLAVEFMSKNLVGKGKWRESLNLDILIPLASNQVNVSRVFCHHSYSIHLFINSIFTF